MASADQKYRTGLAHLQAERLGSAENCFRAVVAIDPTFALGHFHLGLVLRQRRQWPGALHAFHSALKCEPTMARARVGMGAVLDRLGRSTEAEAEFRRAIATDPALKEAYLFLGELLRSRGEWSAARTAYEALLAKYPDDAEGRFGRGFLNLIEGNLTSGWRDYEFRAARRGPVDPALLPQWRGENPADKRLLVYAEQGIGDSIQFLRYIPILAEMGAKVLLAVPVTLMDLVSRLNGVHEIVRPTYTPPSFDFSVPLPSLPLYCNTTLANIPWHGAYLSQPPGDVSGVARRDETELVVALAWAGNSDHPNDRNRSLAVAQIKLLLRMNGIRWVILQNGSGASELGQTSHIVQLGSKLTNFSEIAAEMCRVDLVISVDTSFCHLAGALGRSVWTLLSYAPDWRWLLARSDSPWYPTKRLFRQSSPGNWQGVIDAVSQALEPALTGCRQKEAIT
jgi:Tfp pilus assembly protein PilF